MAVISLDLASVATWPNANPLLARPGANDVQGSEALGVVVRSAAGLAVDRHEASGLVAVDRDRVGDPGPEAALEGLGFQRHEKPSDAIARGDAVGQGEVQGEPRLPVPGPAMDGGGSITPADDSADRDDGDIDQEVFAIPNVPRVRRATRSMSRWSRRRRAWP